VTSEIDSWISQLRKGVVEVAILGMLSHGEMYGSQIVESLGSRPELAISAGTVYPLLSRLRSSGLIDSVWRESPVGPPRKYYTLTDEGRESLSQMVLAWHRVSEGIDAVLAGGVRRADS
jgi:PadR family transcriptional regulator PadR